MMNHDYSHLYDKNGSQTTKPAVPPPARYDVPLEKNAAAPAAPQPAHYASSSIAPPPARPAEPKKPFSPIPLLLVAGVVFLFLGGIIFLTSTWDMLPDTARAVSLLSASVIAFSINILAERVLKLPKTGLAFYILGCIFLPLALGGIGAFSLLGEWFSFHGDGGGLLMTLIFLCVSATSFLGQSNYKSSFLAWLSLAGIGGMWTSLNFFLVDMLEMHSDLSYVTTATIAGAMQTILAVGSTACAESYLRRHEPGSTPLSKAWLPYLMLVDIFALLILTVVSDKAPLAAFILSLLTALLCLYERFISGRLHAGIFSFGAGLMISLFSFCNADLFADAGGFQKYMFVLCGALILLLTLGSIQKFRPQTRNTLSLLGWILCIPAIPCAFISMCIEAAHTGAMFLFLLIPLLIAAIHFAVLPKNPYAADTPHSVLNAALLFALAVIGTQEDALLIRVLLIFSALLLLVQSFFSRRLWPLVLSICTCISFPLLNLPHPSMWLMWLCTTALLGSAVYAHLMRRPVLEHACTFAGIPFLLLSCCHTFLLFAESTQSWILTLAVLTLLYIAEAVLFRDHSRSRSSRMLISNLSIFLIAITLIAVWADSISIGWTALFCAVTAVFAAANLRRPVNVPALPMMIFLFTALNELIVRIDSLSALSENMILGLQVGSYILMLLLFAGMGRLLLPDGFYDKTNGRMQLDWGLLAAALPALFAANTIDWYPSILSCLLLSVYSLLYIGRVRARFIPTLLASAFGCLTIFFHNVNDPFGILAIWHEADFKSPQILLYLLPMHLFILSLLWILPKKFRESVHIARFVMYCITMLCLLFASLSFNRAEDGIVLAAFSLVILIGSFFVKRLRWFTLGFSVLCLMTLKLTWEFWKSLHWGIYLFLAGAVLIGIAFYYEYVIRRADEREKPAVSKEHPEGEETPDEPKEKIKLFKEWNW